ncbi:hypothetical protein Tco_1028938 [Tanacetum coccineum]|uniref:Reverse transcriptase domain-containing protein n=1 Tax=Tanacetum coccineum TaxID=301880 RepID=A0ABQ5G474_9ASTR
MIAATEALIAAKRLCLTALAPSFVDTVDATPGRPMSREVGYGITDVWDDMVRDMVERAPTTLEELSQRVTDLVATLARDTHEMHAWQAWSQDMDCNRAVHAELLAYRAEGHDKTREPEPARDPEPQDGPTDVSSSSHRSSGNGDDSYESGSGRRTERAARECTYSDFVKCQPFNFKGTEGVVSLTQWFEKMEFVFYISNCTVVCQIKFATCTLLGNALT